MNESELLVQLQTGTPAEKRQAALKLGMMRNPVIIPDLLRAAEADDDGLHSLIASALAGLGDAAMPRLQSALQHDNANVRLTAVMALRHMGRGDAVAWLRPLCDDTAPKVRDMAQAACDALSST